MELNKEVSDKYEVTGLPAGSLRRQYNGFGTIDLAEIDLARADQLFAREFPHLKLKPVKKSEAVAKKSDASPPAPQDPSIIDAGPGAEKP